MNHVILSAPFIFWSAFIAAIGFWWGTGVVAVMWLLARELFKWVTG